MYDSKIAGNLFLLMKLMSLIVHSSPYQHFLLFYSFSTITIFINKSCFCILESHFFPLVFQLSSYLFKFWKNIIVCFNLWSMHFSIKSPRLELLYNYESTFSPWQYWPGTSGGLLEHSETLKSIISFAWTEMNQ